MWARIENNIVMELIDFDPAGRFHPSLIWVECPLGTSEKDIYNRDGTFSPYIPPVIIPNEVSRAQGRSALHNAGLIAAVETLMANPLTNPLTVIAWQDAQTFNRNSPTLIAVAAELGLTDTEIDDLFTAASEMII